MKHRAPEFSRPLAVDRVPQGGSTETIAAEPSECQALAERLGLPAVHALAAVLDVTPWRGGGFKIAGTLSADLDRISVVSLETFRSQLRFPVLRFFLPAGATVAHDEADTDPIVHGEVDLGELVAETLAVELDPYPRRPGEVFESEEENAAAASASPFAALSRLKPK